MVQMITNNSQADGLYRTIYTTANSIHEDKHTQKSRGEVAISSLTIIVKRNCYTFPLNTV